MPKKLTHPDSNVTVEVNDDVVATYETQGWEVKTPKK